MNGSWQMIWPWQWQWPFLFLIGMFVSVCILLFVFIYDFVIQKKRRKIWESLILNQENSLNSKIKNKFVENASSSDNSNKSSKKSKSSKKNIENISTLYTFSIDDDLQGTIASRLWRKWIILRRTATILLVLSLISALGLFARPSKISDAHEQASTRDIVLCLDVSGSTLPYDQEVLQSYLSFVEHFQGERIGLSIFNSTSRTVFPLTDDYELVKKQLSYASKLLNGVQTQSSIDKMQQRQYQQISDWLDGTQNRKESTSLIGDGLVSCAAMIPGFIYGSTNNGHRTANRFHRNASIVLATDNVVSGKPTYTLQQALDLTKQAHITVDGLYSGSTENENNDTTLSMKNLIETHGGTFLTRNNDSVLSLVRKIEQTRGIFANKNNQSALSDDPDLWILLTILCFIVWLTIARSMKR